MPLRDRVHPDVQEGLEGFFAIVGPEGLRAIEDIPARREKAAEMFEAMAAAMPPNERVEHEDRMVPGPAGAPDIRLRIYRPVGASGTLPGVYHIHGGGMIMGSVEGEQATCEMFAEELQAVVTSVEYRLAPEHPHPAPVEDCYAGLTWVAEHADELGVDPDRLAIYGGSAGGGLAAGTVLMARERGGPKLAFQMLIYPMIDDRNETPSSQEIIGLGVWDRDANVEGWACYLGDRVGTDQVDSFGAPAREQDLSGLPPAYIDVGELDAFRDEDVDYAMRLMRAGVPTELHVYPGAVHASEMFTAMVPYGQRIISWRKDALRTALGVAAAV